MPAEAEELEREVEQLHEALGAQTSFILQGYIITIRPVGDGTFIVRCPTLHAAAQEGSTERAIESLREAMEVSIAGRRQTGTPIPPEDLEAKGPYGELPAATAAAGL